MGADGAECEAGERDQVRCAGGLVQAAQDAGPGRAEQQLQGGRGGIGAGFGELATVVFPTPPFPVKNTKGVRHQPQSSAGSPDSAIKPLQTPVGHLPIPATTP